MYGVRSARRPTSAFQAGLHSGLCLNTELPAYRDEPQKSWTLSGASQSINRLLEIASPTPKRR